MKRYRGLLLAVLGLAMSGCATPAARPAAEPLLRSDLGLEWLRWPPNDGCDGAETAVTLPPGTRIDRYGRDTGSYFAVLGTPYAARSLPYNPARQPYTVYEVVKPLTVQACKIAPWFGEPGGGGQFKAAEPAAQLKAEGVIAPR